jgi:hypothetical protein
MSLARRFAASPILLGLGFAAATGAYGQVGTINSVVVSPRVYNDVTNAILTVVTNYPSLISFSEKDVSSTNGYANRDVWHFSSDGGATAYPFQNNDYFQVTMKVTLVGDPATPRKEAGFVFNNPANDGGEFILDTDAHEVVAFGGFLPFYAFPKFFNSGDTVTMGITYFRDSNGKNAIIYSANGTNSPPLEFGNTEQGVINNTTIGGYFQIQTTASNPTNSGSARFSDISITPAAQVGIAAAANLPGQQIVFWPAALSNLVLQVTTNLASPNWTTVTNGTPIVGLAVTNTLPSTFYRLEAP